MYKGVYRGTNPQLILKFKTDVDFDFENIERILVTLKSISGSKKVTKEKDDLILDNETKRIYVPLTQQDTLSFPTGFVDIQVRILFDNDVAIATKVIKNYPIKEILEEGVI